MDISALLNQPLHHARPVVYLVGAGPGDIGLLSLRGLALLSQADCIIHDALMNRELLDFARPGAEIIDAGKRAKKCVLTQDQTNELMAERALEGRIVVRLKGGDPYVFGRGGEEALYLKSRGVNFEVAPNVTSALAAAAYAGIPVTHREIASTVTFVTGHESARSPDRVDYRNLASMARAGGTLCFYMSLGKAQFIQDELIKGGLSPRTAAAIVVSATLPRQKTVRTDLEHLAQAIREGQLQPPAILFIGEVVNLGAAALDWFSERPLSGRTVAITRAEDQSSELATRLEALGAAIIACPTIRIEEPQEWRPIDEALTEIGGFDWLLLTSVNGVKALGNRLEAMGRDARLLGPVRIGVTGSSTSQALAKLGIKADLIPDAFTSAALAEMLIERGEAAGKRFLLLRADIASPTLPRKLLDAGAAQVADLEAYRTRPIPTLDPKFEEKLLDEKLDWITFTSASTVASLIGQLGERRPLLNHPRLRIASIGPVTSEALAAAGLKPHVQANPSTIQGLVDAMVEYERKSPPEPRKP